MGASSGRKKAVYILFFCVLVFLCLPPPPPAPAMPQPLCPLQKKATSPHKLHLEQSQPGSFFRFCNSSIHMWTPKIHSYLTMGVVRWLENVVLRWSIENSRQVGPQPCLRPVLSHPKLIGSLSRLFFQCLRQQLMIHCKISHPSLFLPALAEIEIVEMPSEIVV